MAILDFCLGAVGLASAVLALVRSHTAHKRAERMEKILNEVLAQFDKLQS